MNLNTFFYSIGQGIKNIFRNKMFSIASMATMAACIFLLGIFYSVVTNIESTVEKAEKNVAITVFFKEGITPQEIAEIGEEISFRPEVSSYNFISADDAWANFKSEYFEGSEELAEGFEDDNPLKNSESFEIYLSDVSKQNELVEYIESIKGVRSVNQSEILANTLSDFNLLLGYISLAIIGVLLLVAIFLISNTVVVGISVRKDEIAIMKLIGATDFFVRAPFVVEGIIIGIIGSVIPLVFLYFMYNRIVEYIMEKFGFLSKLVEFIPVDTVFRTLTPIGLALGFGIGFIGSFATTRKHLRV